MNLVASLVLAASAFAAPLVVRSEIVFAGIVNDERAPRFLLSSTDDKSQQWSLVGETFGGFTVRAFDPETGILTLEKGRVLKQLRLNQAPINEASLGARSSMSVQPAATGSVHLRIIQLKRSKETTDAALKAKAGEIVARFRGGAKFEDLAREFSQETRAARGGDWGWIERTSLKDTFKDVVFSLQRGEISAPIVTEDGCFILFAEDRREAGGPAR